MDEKIKNILDRLSKSKFRSSFFLTQEDKLYIKKKGMEIIREQAKEFISKRIAPSKIKNDTGTCCRRCLEKWHHISKNKNMTDDDIKYVVDIIMSWIEKEYNNYKKTT